MTRRRTDYDPPFDPKEARRYFVSSRDLPKMGTCLLGHMDGAGCLNLSMVADEFRVHMGIPGEGDCWSSASKPTDVALADLILT